MSLEPVAVIPLKHVINISNWRFFISVYKFAGIWPPSVDPRNPLPRRLYFLWTVLLHSIGTFVYIATLLLNIAINQKINDLYITLTEIGMLAKTSIFFKRHQRFQTFVQDLFENPIFALRDSEEERIYSKNIRHYQTIINFYIWSCFVVIVSAGLSSIFSDPITLSYPAWYPFDYYSSRNLAYYCIFVYQNCGMAMHCLLNLIWDCLMPFLMVNLQSQFEMLRMRLERGFKQPKDAERTRMELVKHIEHYNALVSYNKELQSQIALPFAIQISITGIVICLTMIQILTLSPMDNPAIVIQLIGYIVCCLIQVYLQCYFGSLATHESANILYATFSSANFLEIDLKNRKLLMMFMIRLRQACKVKTMQIYAMDRTTFMSILNMSYSLFAVMRRMKGSNKYII